MGLRSIYWDACVFHALIGREAGRHEACAVIEKAALAGQVQIYTSAVTFVECVWIKGHPDKLSKEHEELIQKYFMHKYIRPINCDRQLAEAARNLIWQFSHLKPKDAIHVASAISQQVEVIHTFDADLLKLSGRLGSHAPMICSPDEWEEAKSELRL